MVASTYCQGLMPNAPLWNNPRIAGIIGAAVRLTDIGPEDEWCCRAVNCFGAHSRPSLVSRMRWWLIGLPSKLIVEQEYWKVYLYLYRTLVGSPSWAFMWTIKMSDWVSECVKGWGPGVPSKQRFKGVKRTDSQLLHQLVFASAFPIISTARNAVSLALLFQPIFTSIIEVLEGTSICDWYPVEQFQRKASALL